MQISNQTRIFALSSTARSRINTVYMNLFHERSAGIGPFCLCVEPLAMERRLRLGACNACAGVAAAWV
jgi:hypothetical protein